MQTYKNLLELSNSARGLRNVRCLSDSVLQKNNVCFIKKRHSICVTVSQTKCLLSGKPVMIVIEYMENGALDAFLRVSTKLKAYKHLSELYVYYYT